MAGAIEHLLRRADFLRVAASGRKSVMPGLILQAALSPAETPRLGPRLGLTASRKVGGAVVRNRARRRLREAARRVLPDKAPKDFDYVIVARAATPARKFASLVKDLEQALAKLKLPVVAR